MARSLTSFQFDTALVQLHKFRISTMRCANQQMSLHALVRKEGTVRIGKHSRRVCRTKYFRQVGLIGDSRFGD